MDRRKEKKPLIQSIHLDTIASSAFKVFLAMVLAFNMVSSIGCSREINVKQFISLVKVSEHNIEGRYIGNCFYYYKVVPVLEQEGMLIFCNESSLQTVAHTIVIPGPIVSFKFFNLYDDERFFISTNESNQRLSNTILTIVCNVKNQYRIISYDIKNLSINPGILDLSIVKIFERDTEKIIILGHFELENGHRILCSSTDQKTLILLDGSGKIIESLSMTHPTIFLEDTFSCYGYDGETIKEYSFDNDTIFLQRYHKMEAKYKIQNASFDAGRNIRYNDIRSTIEEFSLRIKNTIFTIKRSDMTVVNETEIPGYKGNLSHMLYSGNEGLYLLPRQPFSTKSNTSALILKGNYKLLLAQDKMLRPVCWYVAREEQEGYRLLRISTGPDYDRAGINLYIRAFKPLLPSGELLLISGWYSNDFKIITEEGVFGFDLTSGDMVDYGNAKTYPTDNSYIQKIYIR
jgi:hypothetical protein